MMYRHIGYWAFAVFMFVSKPGEASIHDDLKSHEFLSVQVKQKRYSNLRKAYFGESEGEGFFAKPGKFRWTMKSPQNEDTIFDGEVLLQYHASEQTLTRYKRGGNTNAEISRLSHLVLSPEDFRKNYDTTSETKEVDIVKLVLKPKRPGEVESIEIKINPKTTKSPAAMRILEIFYTGGNRWHIEFKNPDYKAIDPKKFVFEIPEKTKITDL